MQAVVHAPGELSRDAALERLYHLHAEELLRYVTKLIGDRSTAADIVQDTFVRVMHARTPIPDVREPRAWLFTIAGNLARSALRRRRLLSFVPFVGNEPGGRTFDAEADHIHQALRAIPTNQANALVLHYQAGFSRAEIARMDEVTEEAIKARLNRGRANFIAAYRRMERGLR